LSAVPGRLEDSPLSLVDSEPCYEKTLAECTCRSDLNIAGLESSLPWEDAMALPACRRSRFMRFQARGADPVPAEASLSLRVSLPLVSHNFGQTSASERCSNSAFDLKGRGSCQLAASSASSSVTDLALTPFSMRLDGAPSRSLLTHDPSSMKVLCRRKARLRAHASDCLATRQSRPCPLRHDPSGADRLQYARERNFCFPIPEMADRGSRLLALAI